MTNDLFPDCKQDSPRLAWMKRHGIRLVESDVPLLGCFAATDGSSTTYGDTEDDALGFMACYKNIPLWHEEAYQQEKEK